MSTNETVAYTPYAATKILNKVLSDLGSSKIVPPQMLYNYTTARRNQSKPTLIPLTEEGLITEADLHKWIMKYVRKNLGVEVTL